MKKYTDEEIWNEVLVAVAGTDEITMEQLEKVVAEEQEKKTKALDSSEYGYHKALLLDPDYRADMIKRIREWLKSNEELKTDSELALGNSVDSALFEYWADNSGEYSI